MKKVLIILVLLVFALFNTLLFSQSPEWEWVKQAGGVDPDEGYEIVADYEGNNYITGSFHESAVFGSDILYSNGGADIL